MSTNPTKKRAGVLACVSLLVVALVALAACAAPQQSASSAKEDLSSASDVPMSLVPNVVSLTLPDAEKSLVASGFKLGEVKYEASDTVPAGNVVSQNPEALATGAKDRLVALVVSSGRATPKKVAVPDVFGLNQKKAEKALAKAGLIGICKGSEETTEVDPGKAFKQSVKAGKKVNEGTKVTFKIALAPAKVTVPNVVGMDEGKAESVIEDAKLSFDTTSVYSDSVDAGLVITQSYNAGTEVQVGTTVTITLSLGPKPAEQVTVPDVITYSWSEAEAAMDSAGLVARYTGDPSGVVTDQDFDAGTTVDAGTVVTLTLSEAEDPVEVPNLIGMSVAAAENATDNLGLSLDGDNVGVVVEQTPAPGTLVEPDSTVSIKTDIVDDDDDYEEKADADVDADGMVQVPNFVGMDAEEAENAADAAGVSLDGGGEGTIVDQTPDAGTMVESGDTVSVNFDDE